MSFAYQSQARKTTARKTTGGCPPYTRPQRERRGIRHTSAPATAYNSLKKRSAIPATCSTWPGGAIRTGPSARGAAADAVATIRRGLRGGRDAPPRCINLEADSRSNLDGARTTGTERGALSHTGCGQDERTRIQGHVAVREVADVKHVEELAEDQGAVSLL